MKPPIMERLKARLIGTGPHPEQAAPTARVGTSDIADQVVELDFPGIVAREFPSEFDHAWQALATVLSAINGADLSPLARRSPALRTFDWAGYLRYSVVRVVRILRALTAIPGQARVLDYGAYFGNCAIACATVGYRIDAADSYQAYAGALDSCTAAQRRAGVTVYDFGQIGHDLAAIPAATYDAIICAGVIEHMPHTPRALLEALTRALKPGALLVLDTPNLGYLYKRLALLEGRSIFCPIDLQYYTELPFEGHHREYTVDEVRWMLQQAGHEVLATETFNYSIFSQARLTGQDAEFYRVMAERPDLRELILSVSRRGL